MVICAHQTNRYLGHDMHHTNEPSPHETNETNVGLSHDTHQTDRSASQDSGEKTDRDSNSIKRLITLYESSL